MDASAGVEAGLENGGRASGARRARPPASSSTRATARTPTRRPRSTRCGRRSATRSRRSRSRSGRPSRSRATSTSSTARRGGANGTTEEEIPIPDELADEVARRRDQLLEAAAEADDDVLTKYLEGEEIADAELEACLRKGVKESILAPVLVGSATKGIGLRALLDAIVRYLPSPPTRPPARATDKAGADVEVPADEAGPLLVRVFKTTADPFVGRLTYLRVLSGTLRSQAHVWNATRDEDERIGQLLLLHGKEQEPIGELKAGEIGAVAKLAVTETGDTLTRTREAAGACRRSAFPEPSLMVAIEPQSKGDLDKMGPALAADARGGADRPAGALARPASRCCGRWARRTPRSSSSGSSASSGRRS